MKKKLRIKEFFILITISIYVFILFIYAYSSFIFFYYNKIDAGNLELYSNLFLIFFCVAQYITAWKISCKMNIMRGKIFVCYTIGFSIGAFVTKLL